MGRGVTIVTALFLLSFNALFVKQCEAFNEQEVEAVIREAFQCHDNPGLAVSVVKDGKVLFSRGFGVVSLDRPDNVTDETLFGIASLSKSFAATLLVKLLYEKTSLTVDSKVSELLGSQFRMSDDFRTKETTFADLMAHKIGVPPNNKIRFDTNLTRANLIDRLPLLKTPYQFRVKYFYSNLMYGLVTRLAEIVDGQGSSWEDLVKKHLYDPLGMTKSSFATTLDFSRQDVAVGYDENAHGVRLPVDPTFSKKWADLAGSGSVITTAKDMTKWMNFHLYGGKDEQGQVVMQEDHLDEVHKPRFYVGGSTGMVTSLPRYPVASIGQNYAHGFKTGYYRGYKSLVHSGSTLGYKALMTLLPIEKIGVFTAITGLDDAYNFRSPLHYYLMDMALGVTPWLNASTICSFPAPWSMRSTSRSRPTLNPNVPLKKDTQEYQGTYYNNAYGYVTVTTTDDAITGKPQLFLQYGWGNWRLYTQYSSGSSSDKFYGSGLGVNEVYSISPIYFLTDPNNSSAISAVKITSFEPKVPPVFDKIRSMTVNDAADASNDDAVPVEDRKSTQSPTDGIMKSKESPQSPEAKDSVKDSGNSAKQRKGNGYSAFLFTLLALTYPLTQRLVH